MLLILNINAQDTTGYTKFYYENGIVSSEGIMKDGKPDGYWKTYNLKGKLSSEGNRKNFELDSIWKFYNEAGKVTVETIYKKGKKNGVRKSYYEKETVEENYVEDVKSGLTKYYYPDGKLMRTVNYENDLEQGISKEYAEDGTIISLIEYKRGMVVSREYINRKDKNGLKQGPWKFYYDNGILKLEGAYVNDKRHGFFKEYSREGNLLSIEKYINDELQRDVPELRSLDVKTDYYPDGKVKIVASFNRGVPEGLRREYNKDGTIAQCYLYKEGEIVAKGIVNEDGTKQGDWIELYDDKTKKAEGKYQDGKKVGLWKYYHKNGKLEQQGMYNAKGNYDGEWKWFYDTGKRLVVENFANGVEDGAFVEYDDTGIVIMKGNYQEGFETGFWYYQINNCKQSGNFIEGKRDGVWKEYYSDGKLKFVGSFIDDTPNGKHIFYWEDEKKKAEGTYVMGKREGEWRHYDTNGSLFLRIYYKDGREIKYDNVNVEPKPEDEH